MPTLVRYEELHKLRNALIGDQPVKIQVLTNPDKQILEGLLDFGDGSSFQDLKLDILFILLNVEESVRDRLGEVYIRIVSKIYEEGSLPKGFHKNDLSTTYKYMRLINFCIDNCSVCGNYPHISALQEGLIYLLNEGKGGCRGHRNTDALKSIAELLNFLLHFESDLILSSALLIPLENLLLDIVDKYAKNLSFKYITRIKTAKSSSVSAKFSLMDNKGMEANPCIPNPVYIKDPSDRLLLSLGIAIYPSVHNSLSREEVHTASLWDNSDFNIFLTSLLKGGDVYLRCAVLSYLIYPYLEHEGKWEQKKWLQQYLPYLVDCLNYSNIPWWFDPFENLILLIDLYHKHEPLNNPVIIFLSKTNIMYGLITLFAQCLSLKTQNKSSMNCTTKFIRLCASFAAYDELYRSLLLEQKNLLHHLEFGLESHLALLKEFLAHKDLIMELEGSDMLDLPPIYDYKTVMAWLLLLKSFSRSVSALRTSLKRNKLAELLLELLRTTYQITQECEFAGKAFLNAEINIMGITLGCICNFVVEFSNLQSFMLKNGIVKTTGEILNDSLFKSKKSWNNTFHHKTFEGISIDSVKTNALWVLRHLMYNCQNSEKMDLLSEIPMSTILEFINDSSWSVQEQCFQLIRNLTCNSRKVVNILLENFKNIEYKDSQNTETKVAIGSTYLFEYLARKMTLLDPRDNIQKKTLEGVLYIIVNLAAVNENKKQLVIDQIEILNIIRGILAESPQQVAHYGNDSKLKLASLWVLNNLLWDSTISRYTHYALEGYTPSQHDDESKQENSTWSSSRGDGTNTAVLDDERFEDDSEYEAEGKDDDDDIDNGEDEFVHGAGVGSDSALHTNRAAIERCKKLVNMGIYDLVKENIFEDSLSVREKARTLLYHMDLLLKGSV